MTEQTGSETPVAAVVLAAGGSARMGSAKQLLPVGGQPMVRKVTQAVCAAGLAQVHWPGRLQILQREPLLVVDSAHNADSAKRLMQALQQYFDFERLILIVGTSHDKDVAGTVRELASFRSAVIVARSRHPRAVETSHLAAEFSKWGITPKVAENVASAVDSALSEAKPRDLICATGSLFVIAEVMEYTRLATGQ